MSSGHFVLCLAGYAAAGFLLYRLAAASFRKARIAIGLRNATKRKGFSWFFGDMPDLFKNWHRLFDWKTELLEQYGPTMACYPTLFFDGFVITNDPQCVQHVLQTNFNNYVKPWRLLKCFEPLFGQFLFTISHAHTADGGALWRLLRKTSVKVFTTFNFRQYCTTVFFRHSHKMINELEAARSKGKAIDMQKLFQSFTLRSIFDIGMGRDLADGEGRFCYAFDRANCLGLLRLIRPWFEIFGRFMQSEQELAECMREVNGVAYKILDERMAESEEELASKDDILSQFLKLRDQHPELRDRKLLRDIVVGFITAGRDTTTAALTWTTYLLQRHPDVREKVQAEIRTLDFSSPPTYDSLHSLKYLDAVIHEAMRMYPPVPFEVKMAAQDDTLPDGTFVPAGVEVHFSPWLMGHSERLWKNPEHFDPERWIGSPKPSSFAYPVFQAGPRVCMGQTLALTEVKAVLVTLFSRFEFSPVTPDPATYEPNFVLSMKGGLHMYSSEREDAGKASRTMMPRAEGL